MQLPRWMRRRRPQTPAPKRTRVRQAVWAYPQDRFPEWPKSPPQSLRETFDD